MLTALVGGMAASFGGSTSLQLSVSRDLVAELKSDLAAQSALEFAQRQLLQDPAWPGTGDAGLEFGDGLGFRVLRSGVGGQATLEIAGSYGGSRMQLEASLETSGGGGNGTGDKALVFLGKEIELEHVHIHGHVLLADTLGVVDDWVNFPGGGGAWVAGGPDALGEVELKNLHVWDSVLHHYDDTDYRLKHGTQQLTTERAKMPAWDLSSYLVPGPDKLIYTGQTHIQHLHTTKTLVVVVDPGEEVHIENCHIDGGIVVWCDNTEDLRGAARNLVKIENCQIGGAAETTAGVIAPACEVEIENNHLTGMVFLGSAREFENNQMTGQLIVVNELELEHAHIYFSPLPGLYPPRGITHVNAGGEVALVSVREDFD
ncbi:MAG: hypothetical protein H8E31_15230 [Planctomycetes bacterium]|nr:hypothetical protein [Planctomycetota bacterium]